MTVIIPSKTSANAIPCTAAVMECEPGARIIVVDDGLDRFQVGAVEVIPGVKPFIFARNCNLGIRAAGEDDVILLNDDALLKTKAGFSMMLQELRFHQDFGLISSTTNLAGNTNQLPRGQGLRTELRSVAFVCVAIPRRTINLVGLLDERFTAYGWEDNDYCRRVMEAGLKIGIHDGCYVDHGSLHSTFRGNPRAAGSIAEGRRIYESKWGRA